MMTPVLYTARNGATISGSVWATRAGPARRPGIVITTGSVQAPETLYWGLAATFAKHGYVVLVYDVQGQGRSDTFGAGPDDQEGVPSQSGQPFYDGTEDGLDFLLSTRRNPYDPRPSCGNANGGTATDHSAKQRRRVAAGLNTAHNPFGALVDRTRIGIAGHSLGAGAVSYVGQVDPRVDAIVAWDNLRQPSSHPQCPSTPASRPDDPPLRKPALGMSNDYGLTPTPLTSDPDPASKNAAFGAYRAAGVDSMQVNIRGGTHFEYSFIPGMTVHSFGQATLRGMDMAAWYTTAWFDKHVKCIGKVTCEVGADRRLLSNRWRADAPGKAVDVSGDGNLYSFYLRSAYDFVAARGGERSCEDMRAGCPTMQPDGEPVPYDFFKDAFRPDPKR
jgi:dienelactone hydrolase